MISGDPHVFKGGPTVILTRVAKFRAQISSLNAWESLISIKISELNHEAVDTVLLAIDHQFAEARCMGCKPTQISRPPLGRGRCRTIDHKFVSGSVKGRSSFQGGDIGSVTELSLAIATQDLMFSNER